MKYVPAGSVAVTCEEPTPFDEKLIGLPDPESRYSCGLVNAADLISMVTVAVELRVS
jgi:hypothetical protein